MIKKYLDITDQLQYISCKVDQLTTAEKEELRASGKEVPSTPIIPDLDDEVEDEDDKEENIELITKQEPKCVDLTEGGDDIHGQSLKVPHPAIEEMRKQMAVKVKTKRIEANPAADEETGQATQPATNEGIFSVCETKAQYRNSKKWMSNSYVLWRSTA